MSRELIERAIPHREPFLLVDEIIEQSDKRILCRKRFTGEEFWYRGHYPEFPLTPGVLLCEAAMQAGAVLLARRVGRVRETHQGSDAVSADSGSRSSPHPTADGRRRDCETHQETADGGSRTSTHPAAEGQGGVPVATRMNNVKFKAMVRPGDTIQMEVELVEQMADAFFLNAKVTVGDTIAVTFDFACKMAEKKEQ